MRLDGRHWLGLAGMLLGSFAGVVAMLVGVWLVYLGATGSSEVRFFGATINSASVGVVAVVVGAALVYRTVAPVWKFLALPATDDHYSPEEIRCHTYTIVVKDELNFLRQRVSALAAELRRETEPERNAKSFCDDLTRLALDFEQRRDAQWLSNARHEHPRELGPFVVFLSSGSERVETVRSELRRLIQTNPAPSRQAYLTRFQSFASELDSVRVGLERTLQ